MNRPLVVGQPTTQRDIMIGINLIADLLAPTLGPNGGAVASGPTAGNRVELLDDASTIVRRIISLGHPRKDIGAMVMRSLIWRVGQRAGDGGATAAVIARAIYREGIRLSNAGFNSIRMARGIEQGVRVVHEALRKQARPIAGGVLLLLTFGFFWRTLSGDVYQPADGGDLVSFLYPTYRFAAAQVHQWTLPLWNPHLYGGAPFIGDIQAGFLYPPNLLLFLLWPEFPYNVMQWLSIGHLYCFCAGGRAKGWQGPVCVNNGVNNGLLAWVKRRLCECGHGRGGTGNGCHVMHKPSAWQGGPIAIDGKRPWCIQG